MGKGDIKSRRGKLFSGSFGKRRPRKKKKPVFTAKNEQPKPNPPSETKQAPMKKAEPQKAQGVKQHLEAMEQDELTKNQTTPKEEKKAETKKETKSEQSAAIKITEASKQEKKDSHIESESPKGEEKKKE